MTEIDEIQKLLNEIWDDGPVMPTFTIYPGDVIITGNNDQVVFQGTAEEALSYLRRVKITYES